MLQIFYHDEYDAQTVPDGHRFPMRKYRETGRLLKAMELVGANNPFKRPKPASFEMISLAHDPAYVRAVFDQTVDSQTARRIGFDMTQAVAMRSRLSCMGTYLAAKAALAQGLAANAAGGSHHARYAHGAGFCVFNDVGVAIRALQNTGGIERALVVDCDVHQGDGTADIFQSDERVFTFSLHCENNFPVRKVASSLDIGLDVGVGNEVYLAELQRGLDACFETFQPDIVFYNAGVDPHEDDRLGKLKLTEEGIRKREACVIANVRGRGLPLVCVMGGGYTKDVAKLARLHSMVFEEASKVAAVQD
ncbi:MAG: histone deacetylase [Ponticaulis sp.]|nr:histone deacetylase [Ponticaulis sp.]|tara:strand:+ start:9014 stop:9931 length:918 start_codon:yes stop_codon:yes gene_type:complete